ncbi:hypothetical protein ACTQ6A_10920 [Lachnospiraceae bacterium LCP25S3_G4]
MGICIAIYFIIGVCFLLNKLKIDLRWSKNRGIRSIVLGILCINTLAGVVFVVDEIKLSRKGNIIERNDYGKGKKEEDRIVIIEDLQIKESVTIAIEERSYTSIEIQKVFQTSIKKLEGIILGENKSLSEIRSNMNLITKIPDLPIDIAWELSDYKVMNTKGELQTKELLEEGILVELKGTLSYRDEKAQYIGTANIFPPKLNKKERLISDIKKAVSEQDINNQSKQTVILPKSIQGLHIVWKRPAMKKGYTVLLFGGIVIILLIALKREKQMELKKKRKYQMMIDYPEIVMKMSLLLGAGMTLKSTWKKILYEYQIYNDGTTRFAYEEMKVTYHEMQSGVAEAESYERFGYRCKNQLYLKLGLLLAQNLKKGSKGISDLLELEALNAFETRKNIAKHMGEEASTKLLIPLFLMLSIVLVIVIIPAFLSIGI